MLNEIRFKYLKTSQKGLKVEKAEQIANRHNEHWTIGMLADRLNGQKKISEIR